MDRVLVLDGDARSALAVVRSLGRLGLEIGVAAARAGALAQRSRFASRAFQCPDPAAQPRAFQGWLRAQVESFQPHMLLPLSDLSLGLALELEEELRARSVLPTVDSATFARVADKAALLETAAQLGLRVPRTLHVPPAGERSPEWRAALRAFGYPAVLKANCTQSDLAGRFVRLPVAYPESAEQALALLEGDAARRAVPALLQEPIEGAGTGVFALCADGEALALFAHRRRLEKPPSGGVSVLSESLPLEAAPVHEALRLLRHYRWQGMAMVEFKRQRSGEFYLMEINPRFWGSLQLAIDSGRDFPTLLYRLFRSGDPLRGEKRERLVAELPPLEAGRRLRWLLGTLDHLLIRLRREGLGALPGIIFRNDLELFQAFRKTRLEVLRGSDPRPFAAELRAWLRELRRGGGGGDAEGEE